MYIGFDSVENKLPIKIYFYFYSYRQPATVSILMLQLSACHGTFLYPFYSVLIHTSYLVLDTLYTNSYAIPKTGILATVSGLPIVGNMVKGNLWTMIIWNMQESKSRLPCATIFWLRNNCIWNSDKLLCYDMMFVWSVSSIVHFAFCKLNDNEEYWEPLL